MMLLVFKLDNWHCALPISIVEKAFHAVAVTSLPETPDIILGLINVHGTLLPVVNIRKRFHLPEKKLMPSDRMIIASTRRRQVALIVDSIADVIECAYEQIIPSDTIVSGLDHVEGVIKTGSGLILVHDLDRFLSLEEEIQLDHAMVRD
jgi:purine-binding chemotaxis protein CheW